MTTRHALFPFLCACAGYSAPGSHVRVRNAPSHREFLIIEETINGELWKSPMSKFYWNSVDKRDLMSTRSVQNMKAI